MQNEIRMKNHKKTTKITDIVILKVNFTLTAQHEVPRRTDLNPNSGL